MDLTTETEQRIIAAATEVFLEKGRDGARMQEIADRAKINKAMLHYYFRSKLRLYQRVFSQQIEGFFAELMGAIRQAENGEEFLSLFVEHYLEAIARRRGMLRFVLWEIERGGEVFSQALHSALRREGFSEIPFPARIREGIQNGQLREVDPLHLMLSLIGMSIYPFIAQPLLEKVFSGLDISSPEFLEKRKREIMDLIWNGLRPQ